MRLRYQGPHTEGVDIPELGRVGEDAVKQGEIIEVDDEVGKRLSKSADWEVTSRTKKGDD